jgi:hypothetical protein
MRARKIRTMQQGKGNTIPLGGYRPSKYSEIWEHHTNDRTNPQHRADRDKAMWNIKASLRDSWRDYDGISQVGTQAQISNEDASYPCRLSPANGAWMREQKPRPKRRRPLQAEPTLLSCAYTVSGCRASRIFWPFSNGTPSLVVYL